MSKDVVGAAGPETLQRLRARIHGLVNRGREICDAFKAPGGEVSCDRCGYDADVHLLRDLLAEGTQYT